ncbi:hypothetical protein FOT47_18545, partial [Citrobacter freundii]|nr:hypothetical protein [Citrobacter freundii]
MNRRLIVQFDPDEPSMSAPTFAEPDQGPKKNHGEAVDAGMIMAARTSERLGQFTSAHSHRLITLFQRARKYTIHI